MKAKLVKESINLLKSKSKDEVLDKLKKSNKHPNEILSNSAKNGFLPGVKYALDNGANVHAYSDNALIWASKGHYDIVKLLLDHGADVHAVNNYALRYAAENGYYDIVKLLLDNGADVHAENNHALKWASKFGHYDVVELLKSYMNK